MKMGVPRSALVLRNQAAWYCEELPEKMVERYSEVIMSHELLEFTTVTFEGHSAAMWIRPEEVLGIQEVTPDRWSFALTEYAREKERESSL